MALYGPYLSPTPPGKHPGAQSPHCEAMGLAQGMTEGLVGLEAAEGGGSEQ